MNMRKVMMIKAQVVPPRSMVDLNPVIEDALSEDAEHWGDLPMIRRKARHYQRTRDYPDIRRDGVHIPFDTWDLIVPIDYEMRTIEG